MGTLLSLCNDVERESGTVAMSGLMQTTVGAQARRAKIVGWVRKAWTDIQIERGDWQWMIAEFEGDTVADQARYTASDWSIERFSSWAVESDHYQPFSIRDDAIGLTDETHLCRLDFDRWRSFYGRGAHIANRPTVYAIARDGAFCLGQVPNGVYTVRGEYRRSPQALSADADIPEMPAEYHSAIVDRALVLLSEHDSDLVGVAAFRARYTTMFRLMVDRLTGEPVSLGG